jgi:hypothetical protein
MARFRQFFGAPGFGGRFELALVEAAHAPPSLLLADSGT